MAFFKLFSISSRCVSSFRQNHFTYRNRKLTTYLLNNVKPAKNQLTVEAVTYSTNKGSNPNTKDQIKNTSTELAAHLTLFGHENLQGFNDFRSQIVSDLNEYCIENNISDLSQYLENMLIYNTRGKKKLRGKAASLIYQKLMEGKSTEVTKETSYVLGWCIEILQGSFIMLNDILDGSLTRRGVPCWYTLEGKGVHVAHEARIIEHVAYFLIKKYFRNEPFVADIIFTVEQVVFNNALGEALDIQTCGSLSNREKQKLVTKDRYKSIAQLKTSYYSFFLPVFLALSATQNAAQVNLELAKEILLDIGYIYNVQGDFIDCYGNEKITGKFGTDIAVGKCTWFAVQALELASPTQRLQFIDHYGRGLGIDGEKSVNIIKDIYNELNLKAEFKQFETDFYDKVLFKIHKVSPKHQFMFTTLLELFFKSSAKEENH